MTFTPLSFDDILQQLPPVQCGELMRWLNQSIGRMCKDIPEERDDAMEALRSAKNLIAGKVNRIMQFDPHGDEVDRFFDEYPHALPSSCTTSLGKLVWLYQHDPEGFRTIEDFCDSYAPSVVQGSTSEIPLLFFEPHPKLNTRRLPTGLLRKVASVFDSLFETGPFSVTDIAVKMGFRLVVENNSCHSPEKRHAPHPCHFVILLSATGVIQIEKMSPPVGRATAADILLKILHQVFPGSSYRLLNQHVVDTTPEDPEGKQDPVFMPLVPGDLHFNLFRFYEPDIKRVFPVSDGIDLSPFLKSLTIVPAGKNWMTLTFTSFDRDNEIGSQLRDLLDATRWKDRTMIPIAATVELNLSPLGVDDRADIVFTRTRCDLGAVPRRLRPAIKEMLQCWEMNSSEPFDLERLSDILRFQNANPEIGLNDLGGERSWWVKSRVFVPYSDTSGIMCPCGCGLQASVENGIAQCPQTGLRFLVARHELKTYRLELNRLANYLAERLGGNRAEEMKLGREMDHQVYRLRKPSNERNAVYFILRPTPEVLSNELFKKGEGVAVVSGSSDPVKPDAFKGPVVPMPNLFDEEMRIIIDEGNRLLARTGNERSFVTPDEKPLRHLFILEHLRELVVFKKYAKGDRIAVKGPDFALYVAGKMKPLDPVRFGRLEKLLTRPLAGMIKDDQRVRDHFVRLVRGDIQEIASDSYFKTLFATIAEKNSIRFEFMKALHDANWFDKLVDYMESSGTIQRPSDDVLQRNALGEWVLVPVQQKPDMSGIDTPEDEAKQRALEAQQRKGTGKRKK